MKINLHVAAVKGSVYLGIRRTFAGMSLYLETLSIRRLSQEADVFLPLIDELSCGTQSDFKYTYISDCKSNMQCVETVPFEGLKSGLILIR